MTVETGVLNTLSLLKSPIKILNIAGRDYKSEEPFMILFPQLPSLLPNIRSLTFSQSSSAEQIQPISEMLCRLRHLGSFSHIGASISGLPASLPNIPGLRRLYLSSMPRILPGLLGPASFQSLEALTIRVENYQDMPLLLTHITSGRLRDLIVVFVNMMRQELANVILAIGTFHSHSLYICVLQGNIVWNRKQSWTQRSWRLCTVAACSRNLCSIFSSVKERSRFRPGHDGNERAKTQSPSACTERAPIRPHARRVEVACRPLCRFDPCYDQHWWKRA